MNLRITIQLLIVLLTILLTENILFANENQIVTDTLKNEERPEITAFNKETSQVDENFSWTAIGGYKIENGQFQVEIRGRLERGNFNIQKTKLFQKIAIKNKKNDYELKEISTTNLFERYDFEIIKTSTPDFILLMKLPKGVFQMKLEAKVEGQSEKYEFEIETHDKWPQAPPPAANLFLCNQCFTFNGGFQYLSFKNPKDATLKAKEYSSFYLPSIQLSYRKKYNRLMGFKLDYLLNKGSSVKSSQFKIKKNEVSFSELKLGLDYITSPNGLLLGANYSSGYLFSINQYLLPQFSFSESDQTYSITNFNATSLSAGGFFALNIWSSELIAQMSLQLPITSTSGASFDGSLSYLSKDNYKKASQSQSYWGFSWGGQYHSYQYKIPNVSQSGAYSLFLSKMELFYGYSF